MLPPSLFSLNVILCERVLTETDAVLSAIRIVDVYYVMRAKEGETGGSAIPLWIIVTARVPLGLSEEHFVQLQLTRPSGETLLLGDKRPVKGESNFKEAHAGFAFVANILLTPKELGIHYLSLLYDDAEVSKIPFTLLERDSDSTK